MRPQLGSARRDYRWRRPLLFASVPELSFAPGRMGSVRPLLGSARHWWSSSRPPRPATGGHGRFSSPAPRTSVGRERFVRVMATTLLAFWLPSRVVQSTAVPVGRPTAGQFCGGVAVAAVLVPILSAWCRHLWVPWSLLSWMHSVGVKTPPGSSVEPGRRR